MRVTSFDNLGILMIHNEFNFFGIQTVRIPFRFKHKRYVPFKLFYWPKRYKDPNGTQHLHQIFGIDKLQS